VRDQGKSSGTLPTCVLHYEKEDTNKGHGFPILELSPSISTQAPNQGRGRKRRKEEAVGLDSWNIIKDRGETVWEQRGKKGKDEKKGSRPGNSADGGACARTSRGVGPKGSRGKSLKIAHEGRTLNAGERTKKPTLVVEPPQSTRACETEGGSEGRKTIETPEGTTPRGLSCRSPRY